MSSNHDKNLERFIHEQLRALPDRKAPRTLEFRVLAAIESRKARPWWHRSFASWPTPVKAAFVGGSIALIACIIGVDSSEVGIGSRLIQHFNSSFKPIHTAASALGGSGEAIVKGIPSTWIYGGIALIGTFYAALVALGATAYKTLYSNH